MTRAPPGGDDADGRGLRERVAALERELARTRAMQAIRRLKARYARLVDGRYARGRPRAPDVLAERAASIAALFTEHAVWDGGEALGRHEGREAIAERMRDPTLRFSRHLFVQPEIEVDGGTARARWDLLAPCTTADGRPHWMAGTERDEYVRRDGRWLHRSLELEVAFFAPHEHGWDRILA